MIKIFLSCCCILFCSHICVLYANECDFSLKKNLSRPLYSHQYIERIISQFKDKNINTLTQDPINFFRLLSKTPTYSLYDLFLKIHDENISLKFLIFEMIIKQLAQLQSHHLLSQTQFFEVIDQKFLKIFDDEKTRASYEKEFSYILLSIIEENLEKTLDSPSIEDLPRLYFQFYNSAELFLKLCKHFSYFSEFRREKIVLSFAAKYDELDGIARRNNYSHNLKPFYDILTKLSQATVYPSFSKFFKIIDFNGRTTSMMPAYIFK